VLRQYDVVETERMFSPYASGSQGLLVAVFEGPAPRVDAEVMAVTALLTERGAKIAPAAAATHWLEQRNHVPSFDQFLANGVVVDTIEIAATWDRITPIYDAAIASLGKVPGILAASAHSSHVYRSGINLYFTFVARPERAEDMAATYLQCWERVLTATNEGGGGIAHHHGIGRVRKDWLGREVGDAGLAALRSLKAALDPDGFMNPGALLPD
jgi:alkyldihydroxyacetonephosphate synthase